MDYIPAKHILIRSKSTAWFGTDHTVNLYRGCCPYNPFEGELQLTRHALELIDAYDCGVSVDTKSGLIVRDIDLYQSIQTHSPVICKITVTTVDEELAAKVEPRAPSPARRLEAIRKLAEAGLFCGVLLMPVLPFLEDRPEQVLSVVDRSADAGAKFIYSGFGVTMRQGQREYFLRELDRAFPGENLSRRYLARYGDRYRCPSPRAQELWEVFTARCRERGLLYQMPHIVSAATRGYGTGI